MVDDDDDFRAALAANLRDDGYEVIDFCDARRVPRLDEIGVVRALLVDEQMPGEDGLAFSARFHQAHPDVPIVLMTAYWSHHLESQARQRGYLILVRKPVQYEQLRNAIDGPG